MMLSLLIHSSLAFSDKKPGELCNNRYNWTLKHYNLNVTGKTVLYPNENFTINIIYGNKHGKKHLLLCEWNKNESLDTLDDVKKIYNYKRTAPYQPGKYELRFFIQHSKQISTPHRFFYTVVDAPTPTPIPSPTNNPTERPTFEPTTQPTSGPTEQPTSQPTTQPTSTPTEQPTSQPTEQPTSEPTTQPTSTPTTQPTSQPTEQPTSQPTEQPTSEPTTQPTSTPTTQPTSIPTTQPTSKPTEQPTSQPTEQPTSKPTEQPTSQPTTQPTSKPTEQPTSQPTTQPTSKPTEQPSNIPTRSAIFTNSTSSDGAEGGTPQNKKFRSFILIGIICTIAVFIIIAIILIFIHFRNSRSQLETETEVGDELSETLLRVPTGDNTVTLDNPLFSSMNYDENPLRSAFDDDI